MPFYSRAILRRKRLQSYCVFHLILLVSRKSLLLSFHSINSVKSEHREERLPLSSVVLYSSTEINPPQAKAVELFLYTALTVR